MINDFRGKHRWLSNFWNCFIHVEGLNYPSVENAYQAMKMKNDEDRLKFLYCKASEAKQLGRLLPIRKDWNEQRINVMYDLVAIKFKQDFTLKHLLLSTGDEILEEGNWWGDTFWGTVNGKGENHLGRILMQVRKELKEQIA